jgi:hypothetical protein
VVLGVSPMNNWRVSPAENAVLGSPQVEQFSKTSGANGVRV